MLDVYKINLTIYIDFLIKKKLRQHISRKKKYILQARNLVLQELSLINESCSPELATLPPRDQCPMLVTLPVSQPLISDVLCKSLLKTAVKW